MKQRAMTVMRVLWPAFMAAGVLEMLVFAAFDPVELHGFDRQSAYTIGFLIFWAAIAAASSVTVWLLQSQVRD